MKAIKFNASIENIVKFEKNTNSSLFSVLNQDNISITSLIELAKACSNLTTDREISQYIEKHGFEALVNGLTEALTNSGFLGKPTQTAEAVNLSETE